MFARPRPVRPRRPRPGPATARCPPTVRRRRQAAVELYAAVARGDADALERGRALRPEWDRDGMVALIAGGCTVDALTWAGRPRRGRGTGGGGRRAPRPGVDRLVPRRDLARRARARGPRRRRRGGPAAPAPTRPRAWRGDRCWSAPSRRPSAAGRAAGAWAPRAGPGSRAPAPSTRGSPAPTTRRCGGGHRRVRVRLPVRGGAHAVAAGPARCSGRATATAPLEQAQARRARGRAMGAAPLLTAVRGPRPARPAGPAGHPVGGRPTC